MASSSMQTLVFLAVVLALHSAVCQATEYMVGDDSGWTVNFDYKAWAEGKDFQVGDKLVFVYDKSKHSVARVDKAGFDNCTVPLSGVFNTGNDTITLSTPGKKWYICGTPGHCSNLGQKLSILVTDSAPAPAGPPMSGTNQIATSSFVSTLMAILIWVVMTSA